MAAWWLCLACVGVGAAGSWLAPALRAQEASAPEYQVKAAWLLNFTRFIDWPRESFAKPGDPIVVGVVGKDPFGAHLENAFAGKTVQGRPVLIKRLTADQNLKPCHLVFLSTAEKKRHRELLDRLKHAPILTVGEADDFLEQGGVISFARKEGNVRFVINVDAAQAARIKVSAKLLGVALSVKGKYE